MWTSNLKKYLFFLSIVLLIGIISGLIFVNNIDESTKEIILNNINNWVMNLENVHINNILSHLLILSLFLVLSSFIIGMPLYIFYIFYNGFSLGFIISSLNNIFGLKGILYSLIYILITKGIFILLMIIFIFFLLRIGEKIFIKLFHKKKNSQSIEPLVKKAIVILFLVFINDLFLYFVGGRILNIFNFLVL